ncbi:MAG: hypothetical protein K0Q73_6635 [Paenibacillus sp.]|nr:hypothetical protein [Paenibacillus sp.]
MRKICSPYVCDAEFDRLMDGRTYLEGDISPRNCRKAAPWAYVMRREAALSREIQNIGVRPDRTKLAHV